MLKNIIAVMFAVFLVYGCSDLDKVSSPPKSIKKIDTIVYAEGRWNPLPETRIKFIAKINSVSIACDNRTMICEEIQSFVYTPKNEPQLNKYLLYNLKTIYTVSYWVDDLIRARKTPVADVEITISLKDRFAEKNYCETKCGEEPTPGSIYNKLVLE